MLLRVQPQRSVVMVALGKYLVLMVLVSYTQVVVVGVVMILLLLSHPVSDVQGVVMVETMGLQLLPQ